MTDDFDDSAIMELARNMVQLNRQALTEYTPLAEAIVYDKCRDEKHIARILDGLLDFCGDEDVLALFKKLCRYYYDINPQGAATYVYAYRDMWDSEDVE